MKDQANQKKGAAAKKANVIDDMEKLKQRREDRKNKNAAEAKGGQNQEVGNKSNDQEYETMMKKRKVAYHTEPENVENFSYLA